MIEAEPSVRLYDFGPKEDTFRAEVLHGLRQQQKTIPCKFFYDQRGSALFDQICELEEYYPTRTELGIMGEHIARIAGCLGPNCLLIEFGSGSSRKTRLLLDHGRDLSGYIPIDISREHLLRTARELAAAYAPLPILPVCADYTGCFELPPGPCPAERRVVYFPGSTIGNFDPEEARGFLRRIAGLCGPAGGLLIGVDLKKDRAILEPAYNDRKGVTAAFNRNLLRRVNRELDADFDLTQFDHHAFYDADKGRIEMHLISRRAQTVQLDESVIHFRAGETIRTECSYKYSLLEFARLAAEAGFVVRNVWTDPRRLFSVQYLTTD